MRIVSRNNNGGLTQNLKRKRVASSGKNEGRKREKGNVRKNYEENQDTDNFLLSFADLKYVFYAVKFITTVKIIPTDFDLNSSSPSVFLATNKNKTKGRRFLDKALFGFWQLFALWRIFNLILMTIPIIGKIEGSDSPVEFLRNFALPTITCVGLGIYIGSSYVYDMASFNSVFNSLFQTAGRENTQSEIGTSTPIQKSSPFESILQRPFRVNLLIYSPFVMYSMIFIIPGVMLLDPSFPAFSMALCFNPEFKCNEIGTVPICLFYCPLLIILDFAFCFYCISLVYFAFLSMLSFVIFTEEQIKVTIRNLRSRGGGLEGARKNLEAIKLQIIVFNQILSTVVYLTKLISLAGAIIGGFLTIKFLNSDPLFALPPAFMYFEANLAHFVIFDKVCRITDRFEELKDKILQKAQHQKQQLRVGDEFKRVCKSVQNSGIQAGGFYVLERENMLIFMDYVVGQIVSLVITFQ